MQRVPVEKDLGVPLTVEEVAGLYEDGGVDLEGVVPIGIPGSGFEIRAGAPFRSTDVVARAKPEIGPGWGEVELAWKIAKEAVRKGGDFFERATMSMMELPQLVGKTNRLAGEPVGQMAFVGDPAGFGEFAHKDPLLPGGLRQLMFSQRSMPYVKALGLKAAFALLPKAASMWFPDVPNPELARAVVEMRGLQENIDMHPDSGSVMRKTVMGTAALYSMLSTYALATEWIKSMQAEYMALQRNATRAARLEHVKQMKGKAFPLIAGRVWKQGGGGGRRRKRKQRDESESEEED